MLTKILRYLLLLIPSLLCLLWVYLGMNHGIMTNNLGLIIFMIIVYTTSIGGIILYIKTRPFSVWWIPFSFLLSLIPMLVLDNPGGEFRPYLLTISVSIFYAGPFFLISTIVAMVLIIIACKRKAK